MAIDPAHLDALRLIVDRLQGLPFPWVVTGSLGMALQGMPLHVNDIDLQTNQEGAFEIERRLKDFSVQPVRLIEKEQMRSYLGALEIQSIAVEIMGDIQRLGTNGWEPVDLAAYIHFAQAAGMRIPVLSIRYEAGAYQKMGRVEKAALLREWAGTHAEIASVIHYRLIYPNLATSGMPDRNQIELMKAEGYQAIINLATESNHSLPDEADLVLEQGLEYVNIPVVWQNPTLADLEQFFQEMDRRQSQNVYVHCAMNMRVSCFVFLYRVIRQHVPVETAKQDLQRIWEPDPTWQSFMQAAFDHYRTAGQII